MAVEMATAEEERGGGGGGAPECDPRVDAARTRETKRQRGGGMSESAREPVSSVVKVGEGAPVAGTPARACVRAGGAQTLAPGGLQKGGGWGTVDGGAVR